MKYRSARKGPRISKRPRLPQPIHRLNRSQHWEPAESYEDARRKSPVPNKPVK